MSIIDALLHQPLPLPTLLQAVAGIVTLAVLAYLHRWVWVPYRLSYKNFPGPPSESWLYGVFPSVMKADPGKAHGEWMKEYGYTMWYKGFLGLRDIFRRIIADAENSNGSSDSVDVAYWLGKCTMDVIGLAGFDYDFNSLAVPDNELANAFHEMFSADRQFTLMSILAFVFPPARYIPTRQMRTQWKALAIQERIGNALIQKKKEAVLSGSVEKEGKDLLSIIVRANMDPDLKPTQRMTDTEVLGQITTFFLAGQETSSNALTWCLWQLAQHQDVQDKLREEVAAVGDDYPGMDTLNSLTYLDATVHEILRLMAPVPSTRRDSRVEATIPLANPVKGRDGKMIHEITIPKNTAILMSILNLNTTEDIWGTDAGEFRPERWLNKEQIAGASAVPGGPRACIGFRFAIMEIKAILFVLIRNFVFDLPTPSVEIEKKTSLVTRPFVKGQREKGPQMPLAIRVVS
ncbi:hypothetical protein QFC22_000051 [Naganishia vaughanmartiniae]|uniref:Uncharacterized protein n=1 Tax=Naganishia vaughanmartiniae TaxID=1424756 RepID=A0ACC2XMM5_9TREE|nr:hypothetical protein QFC22_000051 [Naganishia vaughanmartiniae]